MEGRDAEATAHYRVAHRFYAGVGARRHRRRLESLAKAFGAHQASGPDRRRTDR